MACIFLRLSMHVEKSSFRKTNAAYTTTDRVHCSVSSPACERGVFLNLSDLLPLWHNVKEDTTTYTHSKFTVKVHLLPSTCHIPTNVNSSSPLCFVVYLFMCIFILKNPIPRSAFRGCIVMKSQATYRIRKQYHSLPADATTWSMMYTRKIPLVWGSRSCKQIRVLAKSWLVHSWNHVKIM